jgi:antitoxin component YwqK of YwqJK toxin-antitoxin module
MKLFFVYLLLLGTSFSYLAQNKTDSKGKQGPWVVNYDDGSSVRYRGQFKNGKPIGKFTYYYPTGEASSVMEFSDSGTKAFCKMYHKNKELMAMGNYINQKKDSTWWSFNDRKQVMRQEHYKNDKLDGESIVYYPANPKEEKVLKFEVTNYDNGVYHGEWTQYFKNGKVKAHGIYKNGYFDGLVKYYYPNGKIESSGWYKHNVRNGFWITYDPEGDIDIKAYYYNDKILEGEKLEKHLDKIKSEKEK